VLTRAGQRSLTGSWAPAAAVHHPPAAALLHVHAPLLLLPRLQPVLPHNGPVPIVATCPCSGPAPARTPSRCPAIPRVAAPRRTPQAPWPPRCRGPAGVPSWSAWVMRGTGCIRTPRPGVHPGGPASSPARAPRRPRCPPRRPGGCGAPCRDISKGLSGRQECPYAEVQAAATRHCGPGRFQRRLNYLKLVLASNAWILLLLNFRGPRDEGFPPAGLIHTRSPPPCSRSSLQGHCTPPPPPLPPLPLKPSERCEGGRGGSTLDPAVEALALGAGARALLALVTQQGRHTGYPHSLQATKISPSTVRPVSSPQIWHTAGFATPPRSCEMSKAREGGPRYSCELSTSSAFSWLLSSPCQALAYLLLPSHFG